MTKSIAGCTRWSQDPHFCTKHRATFAEGDPSCHFIKYPAISRVAPDALRTRPQDPQVQIAAAIIRATIK